MSQILMGFVGDVLVNRDRPEEVFGRVREVLNEPSILFANLESACTDHPKPVPGASGKWTPRAHTLDVYARVGFNVMALANNHILDAGYEALLENLARLKSQGVSTCGAGACMADARAPAILKANGLRVAFLAYASVFPFGYEARSDAPGLAPLRAYNFWREQFPRVHMPGADPLITTVPDETDLAHLAQDISKARDQADLVIASFHWGVHMMPFHLTDHETRTARFCIDHGVDMVIGHHHHALRGMEWYRGKPIMYGLGHFAFETLIEDSAVEYKRRVAEIYPSANHDRYPYTTAPREGWPLLPMHEDTRMTVVAWATADRNGVNDIGFLPCRLAPDGVVHPLRLGTAESNEVVDYLTRCNQSQSLNGRIVGEARELGGLPTLRVVPEHAERMR
jgi:poly-gamma-glutamate synthesis protein (capsule biosynthesis protein)